LESFTQYDFVPGDQIIFFEDFSQDAIGDFPDLWTTDGSGEVRTINIAPGKWLHPTVKDKTFALMKTIDFPNNFIVEFDYIPTVKESGYELTLYNEKDKELNTGLFPGDQGFRLYFSQRNWHTRGYKQGFDSDVQGGSEKNTIVENSVNHVIVWVQNRRVRVYHLGEKILDLPTALHPNTTFNRLRFFGWDMYDMPFISNIKVTTAAPDVRSKLLTEGKIISYGINFDSGKDVMKPESYGAVKAIADVLKENPDVKVRVVGHTDSDGNANANLDLSKRRAAAVKDSIIKNFGIDAARIETDGKGQSEPLASNNTAEDKAKNRRVEFVKI
jgi:flagellar motor protein MotB